MSDPEHPGLALILVDGLGADMVDSRATPFLASLEDHGRVRPVLGYSDAQRAALFTGKWPDELNYWFDAVRDPGQSPFKAYEKLRFIDRVPSDFVRRGSKYMLSRLLSGFLANRHGYADANLFNMPLWLAGQFAPAMRAAMFTPGAFGEGRSTLFDIVKNAGGDSRSTLTQSLSRRGVFSRSNHYVDALNSRVRDGAGSVRLDYIYLHSLDMTAHRAGIESDAFRHELRGIDRLLERIVSAIRESAPERRILITSDHGMTQTHTFVDFTPLLESARRERTFLPALDSTMVRLWHIRDDVRQQVRARVVETCPGRFLEPEELTRLHVNFRHDMFGQDIYLIEPGYSIFPNFHSLLKPLAMHAYHPDNADQDGFMAVVDADTPHLTGGETLEMVDTFGLAIDLAGLNSAKP